MQEVKCTCPKCGADIKYIATREGNIVVKAEYTEIIKDNGRAIQGHFRHICAGIKETGNKATDNGVKTTGQNMNSRCNCLKYEFRGKRTDTGEWAYGSLVELEDGQCIICVKASTNTLQSYTVIPETVGIYSGFLDNNNRFEVLGNYYDRPELLGE